MEIGILQYITNNHILLHDILVCLYVCIWYLITFREDYITNCQNAPYNRFDWSTNLCAAEREILLNYLCFLSITIALIISVFWCRPFPINSWLIKRKDINNISWNITYLRNNVNLVVFPIGYIRSTLTNETWIKWSRTIFFSNIYKIFWDLFGILCNSTFILQLNRISITNLLCWSSPIGWS